MKKLFTTIITLLLLSNTLSAQNDFQINSELWYGAEKYDEIFAFVPHPNGGFIAVGSKGYHNAVSQPDIWIVKTDMTGDLIWETTIGHADSSEIAYDIIPTNDNNFIIVGEQYKFNNGSHEGWEALVLKIDEDGNQIWLKKYGDGTYSADVFKNIKHTNDGGFIICGTTKNFGAQWLDAWLFKIDENGNEEWNAIYGEENYELFEHVFQTSDNGYLASGYTNSDFGNGDYDFYVVKTDETGNIIWEKTYGTEVKDRAYSFLPLQNGNYLISGSYLNAESEKFDIKLVEIEETNGDVIWEQTYQDTTDCNESVSAIETTDNCILLTYTSNYIKVPPYPSTDLRLLKINQEHEIIADSTIGGNGSEEINCIRYLENNKYLLAGRTTSQGAGFSDAWWISITDLSAPPVSTEMLNKEEQVYLYPNPSKGLFNIENITAYYITDLNG
ncbi:MAG: hypothetical protein B7C24_01665 [Bacteroidetes bacterium 4572_77]|nr:MAG: hypothetical protein B7C24_01665 [Bacteroidetes bacterium 4572_77]